MKSVDGMENQIKSMTACKLSIAQIITGVYPGEDIPAALTKEGIRFEQYGFTWMQISKLLSLELSLRGFTLSSLADNHENKR